MTRTLQIRSTGGFDNFIKLSSTLKRRRFAIDKISLESIDQRHFDLEVTLMGDEKSFDQAMRYMKKNEDVYYITEKMEV
jgi:acetolactate synthase small subunit